MLLYGAAMNDIFNVVIWSMSLNMLYDTSTEGNIFRKLTECLVMKILILHTKEVKTQVLGFPIRDIRIKRNEHP